MLCVPFAHFCRHGSELEKRRCFGSRRGEKKVRLGWWSRAAAGRSRAGRWIAAAGLQACEVRMSVLGRAFFDTFEGCSKIRLVSCIAHTAVSLALMDNG